MEWYTFCLASIFYWYTFILANAKVITKAAYVIIGVNMQGLKDVLGIWVGENEPAKYWLTVLNELRNRGVKGIP